MSGPELFTALIDAGCEIGNHESDLHVRCNATSLALVQASGLGYSGFWSEVDGYRWLEVPFAFAPFWQAKGDA